MTQLLDVGDLQLENSWMKFGHGLNQLAIVSFYDFSLVNSGCCVY